MLIPSIDLMNGKAVQLKQGKEKVLEREDVFELAKYYSRFGDIAVVDLDCAMGNGNDNEELIKQLCKIASCRVGGGIRTVEKAKRLIAAGAKKIIIGTAASEEFLSQLPKDRVIVAIDSKNGRITTEGWTKELDKTPLDFIKHFDKLCSGYLYTVVEKEGMMQGCDMASIEELKKATKKEFVAAGGICSIEEIVDLNRKNISTQLGMCIYTDTVKLEDAFLACLDFEKGKGLIPTIVQDIDTKQVLMLAYSNEKSLRKTFKKGLATYFSRSRQELWTKGETSGNIQELQTVRFDCDFDTLLFKVKQKGNACHLDRFSCFEDKEFSVFELFELLKLRKENMPESSFTTKLFKDKFLLKRKIMEEAFEVVNFEQGDGLGWEVADLAYFILTFMAENNVTPQEILNNLASRSK
ncbi:MAG TPA: bifunctional phosphoribosyl-AMP cyclohydrolase/phosphoribosyl-ATP diphosphatase HisIE [Candidatus Gastranaerophilaceae bacterium]|nr:bifunctional phosphoribosyl-AMP cyclohydrolase/phosphoribosyl-ATP diphosphatase HisIE [Candidatus Gastranaerophilaceae bacterium]HPT42077.1 bifunctional phosphoribosyl-AMP cyclohydrolase/phosphoribosyl-ATP diphosphatase HisIE [Candidatus Gastranaerophilaceae bacterium]